MGRTEAAVEITELRLGVSVLRMASQLLRAALGWRVELSTTAVLKPEAAGGELLPV